MNLFFRTLLVSSLSIGLFLHPVSADNLHEMVEAVEMARSRNTDKQTVISLCDKILERDVIADFLTHGTSPAYQATGELSVIDELGTRVEAWKEELEENPKSERLNYLLAIASRHYRARPKQTGRLNLYPPVRISITREGAKVSGVAVDKGRDFEESAMLALPQKALIGLAGNYTTGKFKEVKLTVNGAPITNPQWQPVQIGGDSTRGKVETSGDGLLLTGVGALPSTDVADSNFFAFYEMDGDGTLEVVVDELGDENAYGAVGIMIRGSLDPSAPSASMMVKRKENAVSFSARTEQNELPGYLTALCASRPYDPAFVVACLREMISDWTNMTGTAYQAAERLLEKEPAALLRDIELFTEVYSRSYHLDRLSRHLASIPAPTDAESVSQFASACNRLAESMQGRGDHEEAILLWEKAEKLMPGFTSIEDRQKRIISYRKLERSAEVAAQLKNLFLGGLPNGAPMRDWERRFAAEEILGFVSLSDPALVPVFALSFHYAAHYGVAREIADTLDKVQGRPQQKAAAKAVALAMRIAARDPVVIATAKKGGAAYAAQLPKDLPAEGLAMIAFELQQSSEGRLAALSVIDRLLNMKRDSFSRYSKEDLLLWQLRLADLHGDPKIQGKALAALIAHEFSPEGGSGHEGVFSEALMRLLRSGDLAVATKLAAHHEQKNPRPEPSSNGQLSHAFGMLDLFQGKAIPMPIIWTAPAGDEVEVRWEFTRDIARPMYYPDARALGASIPALDRRYTLDIHAIGAKHPGGEIPDDSRIASLPGVASTGQWKGAVSPRNRWLIATFTDEDGKVHRSPSIPAALGKNLISPIKIDELLGETGAWSADSKWFWGAPLKEAFPGNGLFLSRLQPGVGQLAFKHKRVPIDPAADYVLTAWMKTDNGQGPAGVRYYADASVSVVFFDANGKEVTGSREVVSLAGCWTLLTGQFGGSKGWGILPLPPGVTSAEVRLSLRTQCEIGEIGFYEVPK